MSIMLHNYKLDNSIELQMEKIHPSFPGVLEISRDDTYQKYYTLSINIILINPHIHELVQEVCNSIANALELHLSCTNPSIYC